MAIKDFKGNENQDREPEKFSDKKQAEIKLPITEEHESTQIKNAHATGDGSFGRNESGLPDQEAKKEQSNNAY
jgi:hypothetical protein